MPLALNAIFGIPTREEKFTEKRDQKIQDFRKRYSESLGVKDA